MKQLHHISYRTAVYLKYVGYRPLECISWYETGGTFRFLPQAGSIDIRDCHAAPLITEVLDWLEVTKNIIIDVIWEKGEKGWVYAVHNGAELYEGHAHYSTRYKALDEAIIWVVTSPTIFPGSSESSKSK